MTQINSDYKLISSDSHVVEPMDLFTTRVAAKFRDRVPRVEDIKGVPHLLVDGMRPRRMGGGDAKPEGEALERAQAGGYDLKQRIIDQDRDGISAEVVFPTIFLQSSFASEDAELQMALARAYNDWVAEIFASEQERFAAVAICPMADIKAACEEAKRSHALGLRALFLPARMPARPYNDPAYDPFWELVQGLNMPLTFHSGTGHEPRIERGPGGAVINYILGAQIDGAYVVTYFVAGGVLDRFPGLQLVTVEAGGSWLAWVMTQMDEIYEAHDMWVKPKLSMKPSEFVRRQCHVGFIYDPVAVATREFTGIEPLMWGNDYPHPEGTWPNSIKLLEEQLPDLTPEEKRAIVGGNAARVFGFKI
jgi:predicted TIM-barrel fold metal-dependent hydrolase